MDRLKILSLGIFLPLAAQAAGELRNEVACLAQLRQVSYAYSACGKSKVELPPESKNVPPDFVRATPAGGGDPDSYTLPGQRFGKTGLYVFNANGLGFYELPAQPADTEKDGVYELNTYYLKLGEPLQQPLYVLYKNARNAATGAVDAPNVTTSGAAGAHNLDHYRKKGGLALSAFVEPRGGGILDKKTRSIVLKQLETAAYDAAAAVGACDKRGPAPKPSTCLELKDLEDAAMQAIAGITVKIDRDTGRKQPPPKTEPKATSTTTP